jgi:hypothetical protein
MKLIAFVFSVSLALTASASTMKDLDDSTLELANVLTHCQAELKEAAAKGEYFSKGTYMAPRTTNPNLRIEAWHLTVSNGRAPQVPQVVGHLLVSRTTDFTGPLLPDQDPKVTYHCKVL